MRSARYIDTPCGRLGVVATGEAVTEIFFCGRNTNRSAGPDDHTPLLDQVIGQLDEYFAGSRRTFTFPVAAEGTPFQQEVWQALREIPYGETRTYAQIATAIGKPAACRAVGMANHRNPLPIVVPCHRVIGTNGRLTGYAGGLEWKEHLLRLEGSLL